VGTTFWDGRSVHTVRDEPSLADVHGAFVVRDEWQRTYRIGWDPETRRWVGVPLGRATPQAAPILRRGTP
jgi:hypothetical protein